MASVGAFFSPFRPSTRQTSSLAHPPSVFCSKSQKQSSYWFANLDFALLIPTSPVADFVDPIYWDWPETSPGLTPDKTCCFRSNPTAC